MSNRNLHSSPVARIVSDPSLQGQGAGIGLVFVEGVAGNRIAVLTVVHGGPAQRDGRIHPGDLIAAVEGRNVVGVPLNEVRSLIVGPRGTRVNLTFDRIVNGRPEAYAVSLIREEAETAEQHEQHEIALRRERELRIKLEREAHYAASEFDRLRVDFEKLLIECERLKLELNAERNDKGRADSDQVARQKREIEDLAQRHKRELLAARKELEDVVSKFQHEINAHKADSNRFQATAMELEQRSKLAEAEARAEAERRAKIEAELAHLRRNFENDRTQLGMRGEFEKVLTVVNSKMEACKDDLHAEVLRRERAEEDLSRLASEFQRFRETTAQKENHHHAIEQQQGAHLDKLSRDFADQGEALRQLDAVLRQEKDHKTRLLGEHHRLDMEGKIAKDAIGDLRRTLSSLEARLKVTLDENSQLGALNQEFNNRQKRMEQENLRLVSENGRLSNGNKELTLRLDAGDSAFHNISENFRNLQIEARTLGTELENARSRELQLIETVRGLEHARASDTRAFETQLQIVEGQLRSQSSDNQALAHTNSNLNNEVANLRRFVEDQQNKDWQEAVSIDRHLHRLHSAADEMHSTLAGVVEAKRILAGTRGSRAALPNFYSSALLPASDYNRSSVGTSLALVPISNPY